MNPSDRETQPHDIPYREIKLTKGQVAIVDAADYELLAVFRWQACWSKSSATFYAHRGYPSPGGPRRQKTASMHRQIMDPPPGMEVDHINGNGLDNRRQNLRICTHAQNCRNEGIRITNTSGFKGVTFRRDHKKWTAQIWHDGKRKNLGFFPTPEAAHAAYLEVARVLHGEFFCR